MAFGDIETQILTASGTIRPPAGEVWRLSGMTLLTALQSSQSMAVSITDGVTSIPFFKAIGSGVPSSDTANKKGATMAWGQRGAYTISSVNEGTQIYQSLISGGDDLAPYPVGGDEVYLSNDFYLDVVVTGTARGLFELECVSDGDFDYCTDESVMIPVGGSSQDIQPPAGEVWRVTGLIGRSGNLTANYIQGEITDGVTSFPCFYVDGSGVATTSTKYYGYLTMGGFGYYNKTSTSATVESVVWDANTSGSGTGAAYAYGGVPWSITLTNDIYLSLTYSGSNNYMFINIIKIKG